MATIQDILTTHDRYTAKKYLALDKSAKLMGVDTSSWKTTGEDYRAIHDDYDEYNFQINYLLPAVTKKLWEKCFDDEVKNLRRGLDSIDIAELFSDFIEYAIDNNFELPSCKEIEVAVKERTEREILTWC